jgi:hypothetical protein
MITSLFMVVSNANEQTVLESMEVLVFAEESLLPKDVDFVVDVGDDFFEGVVVELHDGRREIK